MPLLLRCPHCASAMQVPEALAGKAVRCPTCRGVCPVPAAPRLQAPERAPAGEPRPPAAEGGGTPQVCPACGAQLLAEVIACMDCGLLLQGTDQAYEEEGPPNLCINLSCGVANPPGARHCVRCDTPLPLVRGTLLNDRYRVNKLLNMGGFGAVYLAADTRNGDHEVVVKDMLSGDPQEFAIRLNFFRREFEWLHSLQAAAIVPRVYDLFCEGQTARLVLEHFRGTDLLALLEKNGNQPFPIPLVLEWGKALCELLELLHGQSPPQIHRDLKPSNFMLLEDQRSLRLLDFATVSELGKTAKERATKKTQVYTVGYAPPEQVIGRAEPRSDLYALAATLYHLATGESPEDLGMQPAVTLERKLNEPNPRLPGLPQYRWFYEVLAANLAEDVNDRYFSARDVKADLEREEVTRQVPCGQCQHSNPVRRPYCRACCHPLTDLSPLPREGCDGRNRLGSRHCVHCGARLR